jgi:phosphoribosylformylglycinamidine synthase I
VVGICNGFQVLTEAGLLPGALRRNADLRFLCRTVELEVVSSRSVLTNEVPAGMHLRVPINHYDGNFTCDEQTLAQLEADDQIVLRYVDNPNGSVAAIAGVSNRAGNIVGLMPHPERASDPLLGSVDGLRLLSSIVAAAERRAGTEHAPEGDQPSLHGSAGGLATVPATAGTVGTGPAGSAGVDG